jgi:hypothetical protein
MGTASTRKMMQSAGRAYFFAGFRPVVKEYVFCGKLPGNDLCMLKK